jgi:hypothetical protein
MRLLCFFCWEQADALSRNGDSVPNLQATLQQDGVVLLRSFFAPEPLMRLRTAARRCFASLADSTSIPEHYRFARYAHSVQMTALLDFGIHCEEELCAPLFFAAARRADASGAANVLDEMFSLLVGSRWRCPLEHAWVRKKFAPRNAPAANYHPQDWHQDGALGAQFPAQPGPPLPPRNLATCWIPLDACGIASPGLEFVRKPHPALLHFTELDDARLRTRFEPSAFWAPALEFGDGLVFRSDMLHRTYVHSEMCTDRISLEYRIFPEEP